MPIEIDADLSSELVPLSWLIGTWEGYGVVGYPGSPERRLKQRVEFRVPGKVPYLQYTAQSWDLGDEGTDVVPVGTDAPADDAPAKDADAPEAAAASAPEEPAQGIPFNEEDPARFLGLETGIWQLVRKRGNHDSGPGMIVPSEPTPFTTADSVEGLRNADGGFDLEVEIVHPHGIMELYAGQVAGPRIDLATDVVARTTTSKDYASSTRMYGLVQGDLLWAWDIAALGHPLTSHASARLRKIG